jgi:anti-anti-sigma regulatory factor
MPYHVSLTTSSAEQHYRVVVVDELDRSTARHLGDWLDAASRNPGARFEIDLSEARWVDPEALRRLMSRHEEVRLAGRLELTRRRRPAAPARFAAVPGAALVVADALLTAVG